jgi:hypothetical protein
MRKIVLILALIVQIAPTWAGDKVKDKDKVPANATPVVVNNLNHFAYETQKVCEAVIDSANSRSWKDTGVDWVEK